jgi:hypothetical protein
MIACLWQSWISWHPEDDAALRDWALDYLQKHWNCDGAAHAFVVFSAIRSKMVGNEWWKASGSYLSKVVKDTRGSRVTAAGKQPTAPYSVYVAIAILAAESSGQWVPSRYWFYDQMRAGRLPFVRDEKNQQCLDDEGMAAARKLMEEKRQLREKREVIMGYQIQKLGKSKAAAKKWRQRHEGNGESYKQMAEALVSKGATFPPQHQRDSDT